MRIHLIAGARPNIMKVAPLYRRLAGLEAFEVQLVHTGQHYDDALYRAFFEDFSLPEPDFFLDSRSGSHAQQTARVMMAYEPVCLSEMPDLVIVVGDVNSTLACALTAKKCNRAVAHLEAGLRSGDRTMPEEINRIATDSISDHHWTPSPDADENLLREGIASEGIERVGNIMIDSFEMLRPRIEQHDLPSKLGLSALDYAVVTFHRPSNVDDADALRAIVMALESVAGKMPVVVPLHPRTRNRLEEFAMLDGLATTKGVRLIAPLAYIEFMSLIRTARLVITDSGGVQEETSYLGIPCLTLRDTTERPITISQGTNKLTSPKHLLGRVDEVLATGRPNRPSIEGWDGCAADRILAVLQNMAGNVARA